MLNWLNPSLPLSLPTTFICVSKIQTKNLNQKYVCVCLRSTNSISKKLKSIHSSIACLFSCLTARNLLIFSNLALLNIWNFMISQVKNWCHKAAPEERKIMYINRLPSWKERRNVYKLIQINANPSRLFILAWDCVDEREIIWFPWFWIRWVNTQKYSCFIFWWFGNETTTRCSAFI